MASRHKLGLPANCVPFVPNPSRASRSPNHNQLRLVRSRAGELLAPIMERWPLGDNQEHAVFGQLLSRLPLPNAGALLLDRRQVIPWNLHRQTVLVSLVFTMLLGCTHPGNQTRPPPTSRRLTDMLSMKWPTPLGFTTTSRSTPIHRTDASALQVQATLWPWRTEDCGALSDVQGVPATNERRPSKEPTSMPRCTHSRPAV
ncbi:hypothetical protein QBC45DRAFT_424766 [Copromyces sp. CBS 386.78]|nr:hypothetical protein QBC45DRAFT_424766 [Copromyces sp. CBS 386.78]